ncbi:hypothetical protein FIBSPDRAFT_846402 [Athelia psychrophila]|uniref:Uncharacterized protein n=1 Tax=Athelia psychrophila TaxID=1759441 RepID=A0A166X010_9AGAM|nr:hypothetical protein FIBSPDRAFT_846402 [Fibularhizoctonia sp. CBS 109695]
MYIIHRVSYSEWRSWLQETASTLLRLSLSVRFGHDEAAVEGVRMPALEVLDIFEKIQQATVFTTIIAPCAKFVTLASSQPIPRSACQIAGLEQSYPQVLKLSLRGNVGSDVLRIFSTISVLAFITGTAELPLVLNSLADREDFPTLLPRLAMILGPPEKETEVREFLAARSAAGMLVPMYRDIAMYEG